jgi:predicted amidophosphoribosyltransferase
VIYPIRGLTGLLAPALCIECGCQAGRAEPLCPACRGRLQWLGDDSQPDAGGVPAWAPLAYEGPVRAMVSALKFKGARRTAGVMAAQIAATAPRGLLVSAALVPVPLHPARLRVRGYNQAYLIASALGAAAGLGVLDCLERGGSRATQVGRGRSARIRGIAGTISARPGIRPPHAALLVDDVITTGSTAGACAAALTEAGVEHVRALAYARTRGR